MATVNYTVAAAARVAGGDVHVAQDATQDAYLEMLRRWPQRRGRCWDDNRHYVVGIAVRKVADWYRRRRRWTDFHDEADCPVDDHGFADLLDEMSVLRVVREKIEVQPVRRRAVAVLFFLENYTTAEVAATLDIKESTVRTQVQRLRRELQPCIDQFIEIKRGGDQP